MLFGKKKKYQVRQYDHERYEPVIRSSICTGEKTAGLWDRKEKEFQEVMLIRDEEDMKEFRAVYDVQGELRTIY